MDMQEVEVTVLLHGEKAVQVTNGEVDAWIPYAMIDDDSEVHERTPVGVTAILVIPIDLAEELELA